MCWADQTKLRGCRGQRARSEKFFLRMYGKLFVLTACVAQNVPSKTRRCRIPHAHSGPRSHAKQGGMLFTSDTSEVEI
jgi:hypothetical protein